MTISRRGFFKRAAVAAGAFGISRIPGVDFLGSAEAAGTEAPALFILNLVGVGGQSTGGFNQGVFVTGTTALVSAAQGAIEVTGNGNGTGNANMGIRVDQAMITGTSGANIHMVGNEIGRAHV